MHSVLANIFLMGRSYKVWTSLVVQWLRIHLPIPGIQLRSLAWEESTCHRATKPVFQSSWNCMPWSLSSSRREATTVRRPHTETRVAPTATTRESLSSSEDSAQPKIGKSLLNHIQQDPLKKEVIMCSVIFSQEKYLSCLQAIFILWFIFCPFWEQLMSFFLLEFFKSQKHWSFFKFLSISLISPPPIFFSLDILLCSEVGAAFTFMWLSYFQVSLLVALMLPRILPG